MNENKKTFSITCTMEERWVDDFLSFLEYLEFCGKLGHSGLVGFFADGNGDFHPEFDTGVKWTKQNGYSPTIANKDYSPKIPERIFDAG